MRHRRKLQVLVMAALVALMTPLAASSHRPPEAVRAAAARVHAQVQATPYVHLASRNARLEVTRLGSAPAGAAAGRSYRIHGTVTNSGAKAASGPVVVHLLRPGSRPRVVGRTSVSVRAKHAARFGVTVKIPSSLKKGSYSLFACSARLGRSGPLGCVAALRMIQVAGGDRTRPASYAAEAPFSAADTCSSGAHTLSHAGDHVYPETGNGGYTSLHSDVTINYDNVANTFLPGTHVDLTDQATQCLTDFSLDFERTNTSSVGPNMSVSSVLVNGQPATFAFVQPTYPGDPNGQDDPDPLAHQTGQVTPVSATNPNPPACAPASNAASQNGLPCPANKLVVTPSVPIPSGTTYTVTVNYTGRPGVHQDGDGTTEGWFKNPSSGTPISGGFVTTEPVGTEDWMPLNDHPSAKPTYDFYDTVNAGKTAVANGELISRVDNAPDANFPGGSTTFHWHSPETIASYLVENSMDSFDLSMRVAASGVQYYEAQGSTITDAKKASNKAIMDQQEDITLFQSQFNGPYPATTNGVVIGVPSASFEEEMQTKITFNGGTISLGTFNHENMHQWWGDHVSESNYNMTFFKEGMAQLGQYLQTARTAQTNAGGPGTPAGDAAFDQSLTNTFNGTGNYNNTGSLWTAAPSNPTANSLFSTPTTYTRPGTGYIALRALLGKNVYNSALQKIQADYGFGSITEPQLVAEYRSFLPSQSSSCNTRLTQFFTQWWDTVYPTGGGLNKPQITGPGLQGQGFPCATIAPASPNGSNGWYTSPVSLTWTGYPTPPSGSTVTKTGCVDETLSTDGTFDRSCAVSTQNAAGTTTGNSGAVTETVKLDATAPTTTATITPAQPTGQNGWYLSPPSVTLSASDGTSGIATTEYSLDGGPWTAYSGAISPASEGGHSLQYRSTDVAGNVEPAQTITWAVDTTAPTTTAVLTPGIHNGWYANPALSFTVADGHGSGDITDPCPPRVLCGFATVYSLDGGPFQAYEDPIHFGTGNHFVQYRTTDDAGRVEATKLVAFKVDAGAPTVNIVKPADGAVYPLDKVVAATFKCTDKESGLDTCVGTVANGSNIDTSTVGTHAFTVTATDKAGNQTTKTVHYQVQYTWNGFFSPITNTDTQKLNLVHAGDLIKIGFSLDGDRGLNVLSYPPPDRSTVIPCPSWTPHSVPAAGQGATAGLSFGVASGHYTYGWQTSTTWAGTCRRFQLQTNDGSSTVHTADFLFFA